MFLEEWKEVKDKYTTATHELNRQLVFAGVAIIWIFTKVDNNTISLPDGCKLALVLFILSLAIDLIQYLYLSTTWTIFYRIKESKQYESIEKSERYQDKEDIKKQDILAPKILPDISHVMFYIKIVCSITAYISLFYNISKMVIN
jgi:hypothetical protein